MKYLLNAFSLSMLPPGNRLVSVEDITLQEAREELHEGSLFNAIGHADTDSIVRGLLDIKALLPGVRLSIVLEPEDCAIVAQYSGPRLPEGATSLPEGAVILWKMVTIEK